MDNLKNQEYQVLVKMCGWGSSHKLLLCKKALVLASEVEAVWVLQTQISISRYITNNNSHTYPLRDV
jgi:hypothetical protein